jgi:uncharacterized protein (TIGR02145 family)
MKKILSFWPFVLIIILLIFIPGLSISLFDLYFPLKISTGERGVIFGVSRYRQPDISNIRLKLADKKDLNLDVILTYRDLINTWYYCVLEKDEVLPEGEYKLVYKYHYGGSYLGFLRSYTSGNTTTKYYRSSTSAVDVNITRKVKIISDSEFSKNRKVEVYFKNLEKEIIPFNDTSQYSPQEKADSYKSVITLAILRREPADIERILKLLNEGDFYSVKGTKYDTGYATYFNIDDINEIIRSITTKGIKKDNIRSELLIPPVKSKDSCTVQIGEQIWSSDNLNITHFRNGEPIVEAKTDKEWKRAGENGTPAWCYYNNDSLNDKKYGKLYNWFALNDPRGLTPLGWHVPTDNEWKTLMYYLVSKGHYEKEATVLKASCCWYKDGKGTNEYGFTALPGGERDFNGLFRVVDSLGAWWSTSEYSTGNAWNWLISFDDSGVLRSASSMKSGLSIRCIKDN